MNEKASSKRRFRNDIILIVALLMIAATVGLCLHLFKGDGNVVKVTIDGKPYGTYSLSENRTEDIITGEDGEQLNRLVIKDGKALVETATCPDKICSNHRPISRDGESIVCLPHRVVVTVVAESDDDAPDIGVQ